MRLVRKALTLVVATCLVMGCKQSAVKPLGDYISENGFTPFVPLSDYGQPTMILKYDSQRREEVVSFPEDCIARNDPNYASVIDANAQIATIARATRTTAEVSANTSPKLSLKATVEALAQLDSVKVVEVTFNKPFIKVVSRVAAQRQINASSEDCKKAAAEKDNLVIAQVLGARGVSYKFLGENNAAAKLTVDMPAIASLDPAVQQQLVSSASLSTEQDIYLGYRAFSGQLGSGVLADRVVLRELTADEVNTLKAPAAQ